MAGVLLAVMEGVRCVRETVDNRGRYPTCGETDKASNIDLVGAVISTWFISFTELLVIVLCEISWGGPIRK